MIGQLTIIPFHRKTKCGGKKKKKTFETTHVNLRITMHEFYQLYLSESVSLMHCLIAIVIG